MLIILLITDIKRNNRNLMCIRKQKKLHMLINVHDGRYQERNVNVQNIVPLNVTT